MKDFNGKEIQTGKGLVTIPVDEKIRVNDKIFVFQTAFQF